MRRSKRLLFLAVPAAFVAAIVSAVFFRTQRTLDRAASTTATAGRLAFSLQPIDLRSRPGGFQAVAARDAFTYGAILHGELCLAGPGGLSIYAPDGSLRRTLRTGLELPVAPITALATGRLRGASEDELLLATAGAGLLLLTSDSHGSPTLQHLLPAVQEARDLTALLPLTNGDLLLGTRHAGVLIFSGGTLTPLRFSVPGIDSTRLDITALAAADPASVLIGTRTAGLFSLRAGIAQHLDTTMGLPDNDVESIVMERNRAYAGTPVGVAQLELAGPGPRVVRVLAPGVFSHALALDRGATHLSIGSLDQGIVEVPLDDAAAARPRIRNAAYTLSSGSTMGGSVSQFIQQPSAIYALVNGTLRTRSSAGWSAAFRAAAGGPALTDRNISALAFDGAGDLYVGFFDRGLDILTPQANAPVRHLEDDHLFCINRLALDPVRGTIAAATADGLVLFDRQGAARQVLTRRDGLISNHITDIAFSRAGTTLATPAGLTFITPAGMESLYAFQGLINNHVYALASAASDRLLAGTLGGLSVLQAGSVRRSFTAANSGLRHNWITALLPLPGGDSFIGTYGAGILRFSTAPDGSSRFTPIDLPATLPHDLVINPNSLFATQSHVFAGTLGHGMLVYNDASRRWTAVTEGLPSLNVTAFAAHAGTLYVGTENGLVSIAEDRLP